MTEAKRSTTIVGEFSSNNGENAVVIEDDGRVGYAYLLGSGGQVCGDVWLYNRGPAPQQPEWFDRDKAPFANPESYVDPCSDFSPPASVEDISVEWRQDDGPCEAWIFIHGKLAAKLTHGAKPGWSALARKDGPSRALKQ